MINSVLSKVLIFGVLAILIISGTAMASQGVLDEWSAGLGQSPNSVFSFLLEVSFMKIDVAVVECQVNEETAAIVASITGEGEMDDARKDLVGDTLLASETIALSMNLQRDTSSGRLLKAMSVNLEKAVKSELISNEEFDLVSKRLEVLLDLDEERGVLEGDRLMYRVEPGVVRILLLGVDGDLLLDSREPGLAWTKGIRGAFLGPESKLREKLVEAAWDRD